MRFTSFYTLAPLLCFLLLFTGCTTKIYPDRTYFVRPGNPPPAVRLEHYKSVQDRPDQNKDLSLALALSGGGSRAANFGMGVMLGLEQIIINESDGRNLLQEVDYLSTVSGGGFAGGAYINARYGHEKEGTKAPFSLRECYDGGIKKDLKKNYAWVVFKNYFNPRLWFSFADEGDALERAVDDHVLGFSERKKNKKKYPKSILLGDVFVHKDSLNRPVLLPMHFANAALLGRTISFPFSPDLLKEYQVCGYTHRLRKKQADTLDMYAIPLSVGIKASGSFPVLISNSTLISQYHPKRKYLHVADGALVDNIGYRTAFHVLQQDKVAKKKMALIVNAYANNSLYTFSRKQQAEFSLSVFGKVATSGLRSRQETLDLDVGMQAAFLDIKPIFFSFYTLINGSKALPPPVIRKRNSQKECIKLLQKDLDHFRKTGTFLMKETELQILFELVSRINTKYSIKEDEQQLLILTGQKVVFMQKDAILEALQ